MKQSELAEHVGCSRSNLIRWASRNGISLDSLSYKPEVVERVLKYYAIHGKTKTQERFPDVSVRSIVERNYGRFPPRQVRWTNEQIIEAAKMSGLVSHKAQAKYFNRPGAHSGSIKSLWTKRFGLKAGSVNGMHHNQAKHFVNIRARYIYTVGTGSTGKTTTGRRLCLWVTMAESLKPGVPPLIANAIRTMADFQRWLWQSNDPKPLILKMIKEREVNR